MAAALSLTASIQCVELSRYRTEGGADTEVNLLSGSGGWGGGGMVGGSGVLQVLPLPPAGYKTAARRPWRCYSCGRKDKRNEREGRKDVLGAVTTLGAREREGTEGMFWMLSGLGVGVGSVEEAL